MHVNDKIKTNSNSKRFISAFSFQFIVWVFCVYMYFSQASDGNPSIVLNEPVIEHKYYFTFENHHFSIEK